MTEPPPPPPPTPPPHPLAPPPRREEVAVWLAEARELRRRQRRLRGEVIRLGAAAEELERRARDASPRPQAPGWVSVSREPHPMEREVADGDGDGGELVTLRHRKRRRGRGSGPEGPNPRPATPPGIWDIWALPPDEDNEARAGGGGA